MLAIGAHEMFVARRDIAATGFTHGFLHKEADLRRLEV
jgi:hypothetical protein